jgi:hypothetical protein
MRLTLRNLLAYLDGILEPEDAQDLAKKIEDSKYAADLMHRIRDLTRRLRLAAPSVSDRGPGLDPNTVAEYLDNTLSPDRVVDFEKVCLESDIHLAEVAACHQVLSMVLGEPMEVDPAARQRMYEIGRSAAGGDLAFQELARTAPPPIPTAPPPLPEFEKRRPRARPIVPDYLREPRKKRHWITSLGVAAGVVCVLVILLGVFGQFEPGTPLGDLFVSWNLIEDHRQMAAVSEEAEPQVPIPTAVKTETPGLQAAPPAPAAAAPEGAPQKEVAPEKKALEEGPGTAPPSQEEMTPIAKTTAETSSGEKKGEITSPAAKTEPVTGEKAPEPASKPAESPAKEAVPPLFPPPETATPTSKPESPAPGGGEVPGPQPKQPGGAELAMNVPSNKAAEPSHGEVPSAPPAPLPTPPAIPPVEQRMGRLMSDDQILLSTEEGTTFWQRVPPKESLWPHQELLVLPTYRPIIALSAVTMQLVGGTELELLPGNGPELPGLAIRFGRMVLMPLANPNLKLRLVLPHRAGVLTFHDADAAVAVEVRRVLPLGVDPEGEGAWYVTDVFVSAGGIQWKEEGQDPLECKAPAHFVLDNRAAPRILAVKDFPKWLTTEAISPSDARASAVVLQGMDPKVPAKQSLLELSEDRRIEVRRLAGRCLGYLGYFDPMVSPLGNLAGKPEWDIDIDQLREAVARDPATAAAVRKALEKQYGPLAPELDRMLWGYTNENLIQGEDARLVGFLDHENLAVRVLSFWNLKDLTGLGLYYRPEFTEAQRQASVQSWRQRLKEGKIRTKSSEEKSGNAARENITPPPTQREL